MVYGYDMKNNLRLEGTFLSVDKQDTSSGEWTAVRSDSHPSTTYQWVRNDTVRPLSILYFPFFSFLSFLKAGCCVRMRLMRVVLDNGDEYGYDFVVSPSPHLTLSLLKTNI